MCNSPYGKRLDVLFLRMGLGISILLVWITARAWNSGAGSFFMPSLPHDGQRQQLLGSLVLQCDFWE